MFDESIRSLIHYFNQYNKIPKAISEIYVADCLNESRKRQVFPFTPHVIYVDSAGVATKTKRNSVGAIMHYTYI